MRSPFRSLVAAVAAALGACATSGPRPSDACGAAFDRVNGILRESFATYAAGIRVYASARDPELSTARAEERAWARADAWAARERPAFLAACRTWPEDRARCVQAADDPKLLSACGLEPVVQSFTDDVVEAFAERPVERSGAVSF